METGVWHRFRPLSGTGRMGNHTGFQGEDREESDGTKETPELNPTEYNFDDIQLQVFVILKTIAL